jgi:putative Ca2+/H+ antiporter (TMEM165/GDT1 family)
MAAPRSWQGQMALGLGLIVLSSALCFGFLAVGQHYLYGDGSAADFQPAGESLALSSAPEIGLPTTPPLPNPPSSDSNLPEGSPLQLWLVTFLTVFVAEMGDKTQLATLLMSAQSQSPWAIFFGSAGALVTASFFSVVLGKVWGKSFPQAGYNGWRVQGSW